MNQPSTTVPFTPDPGDEDRIVAALRGLTASELAELGLPYLAYVKTGRAADGDTEYVLYAADGYRLAITDTIGAAEELAGERLLTLVPVH